VPNGDLAAAAWVLYLDFAAVIAVPLPVILDGSETVIAGWWSNLEEKIATLVAWRIRPL